MNAENFDDLISQRSQAVVQNDLSLDQSKDFGKMSTKGLFVVVGAAALGVACAIAPKMLGMVPESASVLSNAVMMGGLSVGSLVGGALGFLGVKKMEAMSIDEAQTAAHVLAQIDQKIDQHVALTQNEGFADRVARLRADQDQSSKNALDEKKQNERDGLLGSAQIVGLGLITPGAVQKASKLFKK